MDVGGQLVLSKSSPARRLTPAWWRASWRYAGRLGDKVDPGWLVHPGDTQLPLARGSTPSPSPTFEARPPSAKRTVKGPDVWHTLPLNRIRARPWLGRTERHVQKPLLRECLRFFQYGGLAGPV